jgi:hypothetical protein
VSGSQQTPVGRVVEALQRRGCRPVRGQAGWRARCPAHDDHAPSLSVSEGRGGRALLRCCAGCLTESVLKALDLRWPDLFDNNGARKRSA